MSLGAHLSISGGLHLALHRGRELDCRFVQIFLKNQMQWAAPPLKREQIAAFRAARTETGIRTVFAHDSYLINLASPDEGLWRKSVDALWEELERCEALGIEGLVAHPGSHTGAGEEAGLRRIAQALDAIHQRTPGCRARICLETTAGQGDNLGFRFQQLRAIIHQVKEPDRLAVCLDTCHVFAAGYDVRDAAAFAATMDEFDRIVGLSRLAAFHLNDSKGELASRIDRHAHIGMGRIGRAGFAAILSDPRFLNTPMFLETPKEDDMDRRNLRLLRRLQRPVRKSMAGKDL